MVESVAAKVPKSKLKWTVEEERVANANSKTLYVIFCGVDLQEFKRISKCTMVKEAWDILQTIHERTNTIKKVLRSLLERFLIKVIVIKKAKGLESLKIDELIESLMSLDEAK
ncbi:hypothetical protein Godav_029390 [Gossypium davidsonii]|uniref:Uncharacterized protein n=2 Tax=Gossypium TaxID=3633 RepID=A0A7J8TDP3_GOSDV|nr:hypothetical protein [Gossypium davidsonii]MBA0671210.1 hypothetical protein [Gossypium klotzschianum]